MRIYIPLFEEFVQNDNSPEAKLRRYLENKRRKREEFEMNRPHPQDKDELQYIIVDAIEKNGPEVDLNYIDVSGVDDMHSLFSTHYSNDINKNRILKSFNGGISEWDVRNVTSMNHMFCLARSFNQDISDWDVSSVTDMGSMFYNALSFNQDISGLDVSGVNDMSHMFYGTENFNQDISGWKVGSVTDMSYMFCYAKNFNQDISGWDVSSVENMNYMFYGAENFNQDISGWNVESVNSFEDIFGECLIKEKYKPKGLE